MNAAGGCCAGMCMFGRGGECERGRQTDGHTLTEGWALYGVIQLYELC